MGSAPSTRARRLSSRLAWADLDPRHLRALIARARAEDLFGAGLVNPPRIRGDVTTRAVVRRQSGAAVLRARQSLVACGLPLVPLILEVYGGGVTFTPRLADGARVLPGRILGHLAGPAATIIQAERVILNFLQHLAGIATLTRAFVTALGPTRTRLLDTRKTTPGHRLLEKYAVARGGGWNHRLGLFDRVLIKDNHLAATAATRGERLAAAIRQARQSQPTLAIEVEVDALSQIPAALEAGADILLLDNFSPAQVRRAVALIDGRALTEASGGITLRTLPTYARLDLDFISTGALVHQSTWVDIGLDWL